jgi:quinol monooxygenase YgiN
MSTLHVVATIPIRPESADEARAALQTLVTATRQEDGCESYELFESAAEPGLVFTVEAWRSQADLDAHMGTDHIAAAFEVAGPLLAGEVAIHPLTPVS